MLGRKFVMIGLVMCVSAVAVGCKDKGLEEVNNSLNALESIIHPIKVDKGVETEPSVIEVKTEPSIEVTGPIPPEIEDVVIGVSTIEEHEAIHLEVETEPAVDTLVVVLPDTVEAVDVVAELAK